MSYGPPGQPYQWLPNHPAPSGPPRRDSAPPIVWAAGASWMLGAVLFAFAVLAPLKNHWAEVVADSDGSETSATALFDFLAVPTVFAALVFLGFGLLICFRNNWARIVLDVLAALGIPVLAFLVFGYTENVNRTSLEVAMPVGVAVLTLFALVAMHLPPANRFYRGYPR